MEGEESLSSDNNQQWEIKCPAPDKGSLQDGATQLANFCWVPNRNIIGIVSKFTNSQNIVEKDEEKLRRCSSTETSIDKQRITKINKQFLSKD